MSTRAPVTGADAFLLAIEKMMARGGQGQHLGLTVLRLGVGFDVARFTSAAARLAAASPIAAARLKRRLFRVPCWTWTDEARADFRLTEHAAGTDVHALCEQRLNEETRAPLSFDFVPEPGGNGTLIVRWRHLLLDGKGVELLLAELGRLADDPAETGRANSWGAAGARRLSWREFLDEAERFKDGFYENARYAIRSLGNRAPQPGAARFLVEDFTREETARINERAGAVSRGLFQLAWFLAASMRAHRAVFLRRGDEPESYQAGCAVQERKRGARHPIWQNQLSQLFFRLLPAEAADLPTAAGRLQEQFTAGTRARMDLAFATMTSLLRRVPSSWYLRFLRANSNGCITTFFYSHTGAFLPEREQLAGAPILHGWHIPSVCSPPGTGLFFSERGGALTATFSWREGALSAEEVALLRTTLRADLLGS